MAVQVKTKPLFDERSERGKKMEKGDLTEIAKWV